MLATPIGFTQGQTNVRPCEDGGTSKEECGWVYSPPWTGGSSDLGSGYTAHPEEPDCVTLPCRGHQHLQAECSSHLQHHFNVLPPISTGKSTTWTLGTTCKEAVNNSSHSTHPTARAQAKHFPHKGQRNFAFFKLSEQIPFKPAVPQ